MSYTYPMFPEHGPTRTGPKENSLFFNKIIMKYVFDACTRGQSMDKLFTRTHGYVYSIFLYFFTNFNGLFCFNGQSTTNAFWLFKNNQQYITTRTR